MRSQRFSSLRAAHHKLLLRIIGFWRKDRTGYKSLSYGKVLERTGSEKIETTTLETPTWVRRGPCPARRLKVLKASHVWAAGGARAQARRSTGDVLRDCLQKNHDASEAVPGKDKGRKLVAFGVAVKNGRDWITAVSM